MQYLVKVKCHFFVAGAVLGEGQVSLFVAGAVLGEGQVSLFVAGAVLGEIWKDSRSAKCCIFQHKMLALSAKSNLCCAAGCGLPGSWSERSRNGLGIGRLLEMPFHSYFHQISCQMLGGY